MYNKRYLLLFLLIFVSPALSHAWFDNTHMAIAKAAGIKQYYTAAAPDITKIKSKTERYNHWYNAEKDEALTPKLVEEQVSLYDTGTEDKGHLLGSVIASFAEYLQKKEERRADLHYYKGFLAHYIGDLGMPLHLMEYNQFNKDRHIINDGIIDNEVLDNIDRIRIYRISIKKEEDLLKEVLKLAGTSRKLARKLITEDRNLTKKEAYHQVSLSASLLKAMLDYADEYLNKER